ncbi:MAG TPA: tetratricopeptide repeat protein [Vicinamibacterales bacterium]|nr:tetratricopeptide repeat protein [Vicinamibacterales bacterium]
MPPWKADPHGHAFTGLDPLTAEEIQIFERWVAQGVLEGDRHALPAMPQWTSGWQIGEPDLVVTLDGPYHLPAGSTDSSRVFVLPTKTDRMRYVRAIEFRPGSSRIHHANIRIDSTPASRHLDDQDAAPGYDGIILRSAVYPDGHFLGWTPGQSVSPLPEGLAWRLTPGSDLVVQLHLVAGPQAATIQPAIGLYFTDTEPRDPPTMLRLSNQHIDIEPGNASYSVTDSFELPVDVDLLAVQPHAHYLAREVSGMAQLPDGTRITLISIADWDLHWQHVYRYKSPVPLPKGTTISMHFRYDNSASNRRNPAARPVRVQWGQQSHEEMGDLWLQVATRSPADRSRLEREFATKWMTTDAVGLSALIAREPRRAALRDDIAVLYMELNRPEEAIPHFEAALGLKTGLAAATAHFNLATALQASGRSTDALTHYRHALAIRPDYARAHNNLGAVLVQAGRPEEALAAFTMAARLEPRFDDALLNVGLVSRALGKLPEAVDALRLAYAANPQRVPTLLGLASVLAAAPDSSIRKPIEAVQLAERAVAVTGRSDANALDVLAVAYASAGMFERAVAAADEALLLDPGPSLSSMIAAHRELFAMRRPYLSPR